MINRHRDPTRGSSRPRGLIACLVLGLLLLAGVGYGVMRGTGALATEWEKQFRIEDPELDVVITTGKMVRPEVVTLLFGLTNGANLAEIPFEERRLKILERIPNIRDIQIERRLPRRVNIAVHEREPLARIASPRGRIQANHVADREGVVFRFANNTSLLPIVREAVSPPTPPGKRLTGHVAAALRLVETAAQPDFADLRVLEVETANKDYLLVTLGNYDRAKFAWEHMDDDTRQSRDSLRRQLRRLRDVIATHTTPRATTWIATDWSTPGRFYASDPNRKGNP